MVVLEGSHKVQENTRQKLGTGGKAQKLGIRGHGSQTGKEIVQHHFLSWGEKRVNRLVNPEIATVHEWGKICKQGRMPKKSVPCPRLASKQGGICGDVQTDSALVNVE